MRRLNTHIHRSLKNVDDAQPQAQLQAESTTGHEANSLRVRGLVLFAAALVGVTALVLFVLAPVMSGFSSEEKSLEALAVPRFAGDSAQFPSPKIEADPTAELTKMKKEDLGRLAEYGWIDRKAGIAHIPVDRAIEILAKTGLPKQPPDEGTQGPREASKSSSAEGERSKERPVPEPKS
jgi:hypothetical protein